MFWGHTYRLSSVGCCPWPEISSNGFEQGRQGRTHDNEGAVRSGEGALPVGRLRGHTARPEDHAANQPADEPKGEVDHHSGQVE